MASSTSLGMSENSPVMTTRDFSTVPTVTDLPVIGWPGGPFYALHISALVSLFISIIASATVFGILRPTFPAFWSWPVGERFAVYLAIIDIMWSISHIMDHVWMLSIPGHPPDDACIVMGYCLGTLILSQALLVSFMSLNSFLMVVKEVKLSMGKYDWKLLTGIYVCPSLLMIPPAALRWLGPSGAWCLTDMRKESGIILSIVLSAANTLTMIVNMFCYGFIFMKIRNVASKSQSKGTASFKYQKTVNTMMKFVAAYIFQWFSNPVYSIWNMVTPAPFAMVLICVIVINMGGLYNLIVYTLLKRKPKESPANDGKSMATKSTITTVS